MDFILLFFKGMYSNSISASFTTFIVIYFVLALTGLRSDSSFLKHLSSMATGVLTTLGILGTFTGIFFGLLDFNVATIEKSVPLLLEGLKVAFGTSILGLFTALSFRIVRPLIAPVSANEVDAENEVLEALKEMVASVKQNEKSNKEGFELLRKALAGDEDSSVTGQLQRLRAGFSDLESTTKKGFEEQIKEFREFSEHMSKAFSDAIIEELKAVIREFNEKISEQFGENFKQLNEAIGKLLEWQEKYREHVETLEQNFENALNAISSADESIKSISESTSSIPDQMSKLNEGSEKLNQHLAELHDGLASLEQMRERAEGAFPAVSDKINQLTDDVSSSVESVAKAVEKQREAQDKLLSSFTTQFEDAIRSQKDSQQQMLDATQSAFNDTVANATQKLNDSIIQLDDAMQKEIESVVRTMAESLSGITNQFVQDYQPLLVETRKVVELSKRAKS